MQNKLNQTTTNDEIYRGQKLKKDLPEEICSIWLGLEFLKITFSIKEDDPGIDIFEIHELLNVESKS